MTFSTTVAMWVLAAYLTGSFPTSAIAARIGAVDLRSEGSGNLGATNVYRVMGWRYAVPVALIDVLKGFIPAWLYPRLAEAGAGYEWLPLLLGGSAVLGHVFPIFLGFRGGKGVATAAGVVLGIAPVPLIIAGVVWGLVLQLTGYVSLASMLGAVSFPLASALLNPRDQPTLALGVLLAAFILFTHRSNIGRLLRGTESSFKNRRRREGSQ